MERSPEIESFVEEMYRLMRAGDGDAVAGLVADDEGVLFVGTDGDEWWNDSATVTAAFREQLDSSGGFDIIAGDIAGYRNGDTGWFQDQLAMRMPDGSVIPMRMTGVVRRLPTGGWECVQSHLSVAANLNESLFE